MSLKMDTLLLRRERKRGEGTETSGGISEEAENHSRTVS